MKLSTELETIKKRNRNSRTGKYTSDMKNSLNRFNTNLEMAKERGISLKKQKLFNLNKKITKHKWRLNDI